jgi:hypothetical protein
MPLMQRRVLPRPPFGRVFRVPGGVRPPARTGLGGSSKRSPEWPLPDGSPSEWWPYDEYGKPWGPAEAGFAPPPIGTQGAPGAAVATPAGQVGFRPTTVPYGAVDPNAGIQWRNPTTAAIVPILASTPANQPVLSLNYQRNLLIVQNNSTATSPDTTPIFYINFNAQVASAGLGIALAAGIGIVFDIICPRDSVYLLQVGGGGASLVVAGVVVQGTYSPI